MNSAVRRRAGRTAKGRHGERGRSFARAGRAQAGVTLLDTLVGTALMLVVFLGIAAAFQLSLDVVMNNKARSGAIALADERMEYIRSLTYNSMGTVGGIPSGSLAQSESIALNGITYTRRTFIAYADDPKDGLGSADENHITSDYKAVKVQVSWASRTGVRSVSLVTRIDPPNGMETSCTPPCGTLIINVVNAQAQPLSGASVQITNASTSPAVDLSTFTNTDGTVSLIGAPAAAGYAVSVTEPGYSTARTYPATSLNTNPKPANLTVSDGNTTTGTFAIDALGQMTVRTWTQIQEGTTTDAFTDAARIATSSNVVVGSGTVTLSSGSTWGALQSFAMGPNALQSWKVFSWVDSVPSGTSIRYYVYDGSGQNLIPDSLVPGNSTGFTTGPIDLSLVSTSTYPSLRLGAILTRSATTSPAIDEWDLSYTYGPLPVPNLAFSMQGAKVIGSGPSGALPKYTENLTTGGDASVVIPNLEWDSYTMTIDGSATGYDIASSCAPQPESLSPGGSLTTDLYLAAHTTNSLLVDVRSATDGSLIPGASVRLYASGYDKTLATDGCGQAFFSGLSSSVTYSISISAPGYTTYTSSSETASGATRLSVTLN